MIPIAPECHTGEIISGIRGCLTSPEYYAGHATRKPVSRGLPFVQLMLWVKAVRCMPDELPNFESREYGGRATAALCDTIPMNRRSYDMQTTFYP